MHSYLPGVIGAKQFQSHESALTKTFNRNAYWNRCTSVVWNNQVFFCRQRNNSKIKKKPWTIQFIIQKRPILIMDNWTTPVWTSRILRIMFSVVVLRSSDPSIKSPFFFAILEFITARFTETLKLNQGYQTKLDSLKLPSRKLLLAACIYQISCRRPPMSR